MGKFRTVPYLRLGYITQQLVAHFALNEKSQWPTLKFSQAWGLVKYQTQALVLRNDIGLRSCPYPESEGDHPQILLASSLSQTWV